MNTQKNSGNTNCRMIAAILSAMLSLGAVSCSGSSSENTNTAAATTVITEIQTTEVKDEPAFEQSDYGKEFHIIAQETEPYKSFFFADSVNGDVLNDTLYERDMMVEDYLGIKMSHVIRHPVQDVVRESVMAGDDEYQLVLTHPIAGLKQMVSENLLTAFNDLEYCDLSQDYWNKDCIKNLAYNGKAYYAVSDYMLHDVDCLLFNKTMIQNNQLENPYELVRSGSWTLDKLIQMAESATNDENGDGTFDISDSYGISCDNDWKWNSFIYSSGLRLTNIDKDGKVSLFNNDERFMSLIEKTDKLVNADKSAFIWKFAAPKENQLTIGSGRVLFQIEASKALNDYRDVDIDFGIVPYPKLDESQEDYLNLSWVGLMCVPSIINDSEMVSKAIELLSYFSNRTTKPVYYDSVLGEKLSRDDDSREMLDIMFNNIVYDAGYNYFGQSGSFQNLFYVISRSVIQAKNANFASIYDKNAESAKKEIADFYEGK